MGELKRQYTPLGAKGYLHNATARLKRRMKRLNLRLEVMRGDGNCQFRALSFQLFGSQDLYEMVRERSVSYLKEYREHYEDFLGGQEEFDHYLCQMSLNSTWGDEITLCGAANAFDLVVNVITSESANWYLQYRPRTTTMVGDKKEQPREIFIAYTYPLHYDAVGRLDL